jgi:hypothetical protein
VEGIDLLLEELYGIDIWYRTGTRTDPAELCNLAIGIFLHADNKYVSCYSVGNY